MYSVQMVLEQARSHARLAQGAERGSQLILAAYAQLIDAQGSIERLQRRMDTGLRQTSDRFAAA